MKNYRNNFKKNRYRNNGDRGFKRNGSSQKFNGNYSDYTDFGKKKFNRNGNASKLIEKYTELAKEALSNGDKIMSENYFQHADHFTRISERQNLEKIEKDIAEQKDKSQPSENSNVKNEQ